MNDPTEAIRRAMTIELNAAQAARAELEARYGRVWSSDEIRTEFDVKGFMAPFMVVARKSDGKKGSLEFQHAPRFYFNFQED